MQKILYTTLCKKNKPPVDNYFLCKRQIEGMRNIEKASLNKKRQINWREE